MPLAPPLRRPWLPARRPVPLAVAALLLLGVLLVQAGWSPGALAQQPDGGREQGQDGAGTTSWQVQPSGPEGPGERPYFVHDVEPGAVVEDTVGITNYSEQDITLAVFGTDALNTRTGEFDLLATAETPADLGAWVTITSDEVDRDGLVTVPARSRVDVAFRIDVPENATPGDHVGGIVTSLPTVRTTEDGQQVLVDARVGARVYLLVRGELEPRLEVEDVRARHTGSWWNPFGGQVELSWTVRNTGNLRLSGEQRLQVSGVAGWGRKSAAVELPEVLPGSAVEQRAVLDGVPAALRLEVGGALIPLDHAERLEEELEAAEFGAAMWVVPWLLVVVLALLTAAAWLLLRRRRRRRALVAGLRAEVRAARAEAGRTSAPEPASAEPAAEPVAATAEVPPEADDPAELPCSDGPSTEAEPSRSA